MKQHSEVSSLQQQKSKPIIIKLDKNNRFINKTTGEEVKKYDPSNENLVFIFKKDNSTEVRIDHAQIKYNFGESMSFELDEQDFIIDDGYRDILIKCGYIVMNNYDEVHAELEEGNNIRNKLMSTIFETLINSSKSGISIEGDSNHTNIIFDTNEYSFSVYFNTINGIVNKNEKRKENGISIYPFDKSMDKFGTCYVSVFAQKKENTDDVSGKKKFIIADTFINKLVSFMNVSSRNKFKFVPLSIKKRVYNWEGI